MATDAELDKYLAKMEELDQEWEEVERQFLQHEQDKEAFAREFGFTYEQYLQYCKKQLDEYRQNATPEQLKKLEEMEAQEKERRERELDAEKARQQSQQASEGSQPKRSRRMRNMI